MSIEVHVESNGWNREVRIYAIDSSPRGLYSIFQDSNGFLTMQKFEEMQSINEVPCLLTMRGDIAKEILPALTEALSKKGFPTVNENTLRGKIEAMSAHLEDMRKLVFK